MKKVSDVFKSIRFAKKELKGKPHSSTDDEEHYAVGEKEFDQQLKHAKKMAMQEGENKQMKDDPCWSGYQMVGKKMKNGKEVPNCVPVKEESEQIEEGEGIVSRRKTKADFLVPPKGTYAYERRYGEYTAKGELRKKPNPNKPPLEKNEQFVAEKVQLENTLDEVKKDVYDEGEYDREGDMAKSDLRSIIANAQKMHDMIDDADNLPEWVQSKITKAEDYISTVANYMTSEMSEEVEQIDELSNDMLGRYKTAASADASKADKAGDYAKGNKRFSGIVKATKKQFDNDMKKESKDKTPPFDPPYKSAKEIVTDKSGAKHGPMSIVKHLAKQALKKQAEKMKPVKESLDESRKAEIVKDIVKKKRVEKDTFESDPVLTSTVMKEDK